MGVGLHDLESLIALRRSGHLPENGAVVEIGAQQLANSALDPELIARFGDAFGATGVTPSFDKVPVTIMNGVELMSPSAPYFRDLWTWVGWSYTAIDVDESPNSFNLDLNFDSVPVEHRNRYQLVTNYGTTEHVANQLTAFKIIHDLTAVEGVMTHFLPSQGMPNHGLVNYNPKFFWMLCKSNEYEYIDMELLSCVPSMAYPYPVNWAIKLAWTSPTAVAPDESFLVKDAALRVNMRKRDMSPFVCPLDIPDGVVVTDQTMRRRYWKFFGDAEPAPAE